jgi:hypothetical protein
MNPWICATLISIAGAAGGLANALMSDNGFALPRRVDGIWCPGAVSTIVVGAFAAFASWAFYGSGAGIDITDSAARPHLQMPALAGAFLIGVVGAKWITNEAEKGLLREGVKVAAGKDVPRDKIVGIASGTPLDVLRQVKEA